MSRLLNPITQCAALLALSCAAGLAANILGPKRIPWKQEWSKHVEAASKDLGVPTITLDAAREFSEQATHIILDARPPADFAAGHIPGAFNVPSTKIAEYIPQVMPLLTPAQPLMTYCSGKACDESVFLSKYLLQNGFTNVVLFMGGWADWTAAKLTVER